jgi:hypothetical protein
LTMMGPPIRDRLVALGLVYVGPCACDRLTVPVLPGSPKYVLGCTGAGALTAGDGWLGGCGVRDWIVIRPSLNCRPDSGSPAELGARTGAGVLGCALKTGAAGAGDGGTIR